jgi:hypothetical protein
MTRREKSRGDEGGRPGSDEKLKGQVMTRVERRGKGERKKGFVLPREESPAMRAGKTLAPRRKVPPMTDKWLL